MKYTRREASIKYPNVIFMGDIYIAKNVEICDNVYIGLGVWILNDVYIGENVEIGSDVIIESDVHIGTDVRIGQNTVILEQSTISEGTTICGEATIGPSRFHVSNNIVIKGIDPGKIITAYDSNKGLIINIKSTNILKDMLANEFMPYLSNGGVTTKYSEYRQYEAVFDMINTWYNTLPNQNKWQ